MIGSGPANEEAKMPMIGLPDWEDGGPEGLEDTPDLSGEIEEAKRKLQASARGDDWLYNDKPMNIAAPTPEIYKHAHSFMSAIFGEDQYTPDAVAQLVDAFIPCLRIMVERDYRPNGATWQRAGRKGLVRELLKYTDRLHDRDWLGNIPDSGSAEDMVNYAGMYMRAIKEGLDNWGFWGEPAREED